MLPDRVCSTADCATLDVSVLQKPVLFFDLPVEGFYCTLSTRVSDCQVSVPSSEFAPPAPSPPSVCAPPPHGTKEPKGGGGGGTCLFSGGQLSLAGKGVGGSQFERLERKPGTLICPWTCLFYSRQMSSTVVGSDTQKSIV